MAARQICIEGMTGFGGFYSWFLPFSLFLNMFLSLQSWLFRILLEEFPLNLSLHLKSHRCVSNQLLLSFSDASSTSSRTRRFFFCFYSNTRDVVSAILTILEYFQKRTLLLVLLLRASSAALVLLFFSLFFEDILDFVLPLWQFLVLSVLILLSFDINFPYDKSFVAHKNLPRFNSWILHCILIVLFVGQSWFTFSSKVDKVKSFSCNSSALNPFHCSVALHFGIWSPRPLCSFRQWYNGI